MAAPRIVSDSIVIAAPAEEIFEILADARKHQLIDGSGNLQGLLDAPERLTLGAKFGMDMKIGLPYRVRNRVVEFEEGRRIAWQHFARHTWRYELEPLDDGSTRVTESWDWSKSPVALPMELVGFPERNRVSIHKTLERLKEAVESSSDPAALPGDSTQ